MMRTGQVTGAWRGLLFASLFLNLVGVGLVIGTIMIPAERRPPPIAMAGTGPFSHALSSDERRDFSALLREELRDIAPDRAALRAQGAAIREILEAEVFDRGALEDIFAAQRQRGALLQAQADMVLGQYLEGLDQRARQDIAARFGAGRGPSSSR